MNLKVDLSEIKKTLPWLGFTDMKGTYGMKVLTFAVITTVLIINSIFDIILNWSDPDIRVDVLKGLLLYIFFASCFTSVMFGFEKLKTVLDIIEDGFYKFPFEKTRERLELEHQVKDEMIIVHSVWVVTRPMYIASVTLPPIIVLFYRIFTESFHTLTANMLFTTNRYYCPQKYNNLAAYFIVLCVQTSFFLYIVKAGYVVLSSAFVSMYLIGSEMRLMALSTKEMDTIIESNAERSMDMDIKDFYKPEYTKPIKLYISYLIKHHQHIQRTTKLVNQAIELVAFYLNTCVTLMCVLGIYVFVKKDSVMGKIQEICYCCSMLLMSYYYNSMGQEVVIQNEYLRRTLYSCNWLDKPQWFKKSFLIVMTRATKPTIMKPLGLFVLDLKNLLTLLKGTYTFYNVLNNFMDVSN